MIYDRADQAIRDMNRQNLKAFNRLKLAKFDEINLIRQVNGVYDESTRRARQRYYELAVEAYILALIETGKSTREATRQADREIDMSWVLAMLEEVDPVTLYAFLPEKDRKAQRLIEALSEANDKGKEVDKALKYWTVQVGQYAINAVDMARMEAFYAAGVKRVMWHTQKDERVCETCGPREGMIFEIEDVPQKHYQCRCYLTAVLD